MYAFSRSVVMQSSAQVVVLNPNSTQAVTDALDVSLERFRLGGGPNIVCETLAEGPPAIESDSHALQVVEPLCHHLQAHEQTPGAYVIACFSDPGIREARNRLRQPVFGMAESGYLTACARGDKFGVLSILTESVPRHLRYIESLGLAHRLAADLPIDLGVLELADEQRAFERLCEVGTELRDRHGADALVLGCAGMVNQRAPLENELRVPVVECVQAAVGMALGTLCAA